MLKKGMVKKRIVVSDFDASQYLRDEADMASYLSAVLEENDPALLAAAIGDIAKAKGMSRLAKETGMSRTSLYKSLSADGNPELGTVMNVMRHFGIKLTARVEK